MTEDTLTSGSIHAAMIEELARTLASRAATRSFREALGIERQYATGYRARWAGVDELAVDEMFAEAYRYREPTPAVDAAARPSTLVWGYALRSGKTTALLDAVERWQRRHLTLDDVERGRVQVKLRIDHAAHPVLWGTGTVPTVRFRRWGTW